jgi:hypothetical protein
MSTQSLGYLAVSDRPVGLLDVVVLRARYLLPVVLVVRRFLQDLLAPISPLAPDGPTSPFGPIGPVAPGIPGSPF